MFIQLQNNVSNSIILTVVTVTSWNGNDINYAEQLTISHFCKITNSPWSSSYSYVFVCQDSPRDSHLDITKKRSESNKTIYTKGYNYYSEWTLNNNDPTKVEKVSGVIYGFNTSNNHHWHLLNSCVIIVIQLYSLRNSKMIMTISVKNDRSLPHQNITTDPHLSTCIGLRVSSWRLHSFTFSGPN